MENNDIMKKREKEAYIEGFPVMKRKCGKYLNDIFLHMPMK